jgi:hypothetical protein
MGVTPTGWLRDCWRAFRTKISAPDDDPSRRTVVALSRL